MDQTQRPSIVWRVIAISASAILGVIVLGLLLLVTSSRFTPGADVHGYVMIFGSFLTVPFVIALAAVFPFCFTQRRTPAIISLVGGVAILGALVAMLLNG